jgi:tRNA1(Val) A37 N6-methylase TrmN6
VTESAPEFSEDALLGGRVMLRQPVQGYRAAIDPILLAAAVPAEPRDHVLDIGCGAGAASLCLTVRAGCRVTGLDPDRAMVRLAGDNAGLNRVGDRMIAMIGDLLNPPRRLEQGSFDHVMANPPYIEHGAGTPPRAPGKAGATIEGAADLSGWIAFALAMARNKGSVTFVHRADRLEQLLAQFAGRAGELVVFPLWAGPAKDAKRVLVRARKGVATPTRLAPGLVLHDADGRYTEAAESVLRHGAALPF